MLQYIDYKPRLSFLICVYEYGWCIQTSALSPDDLKWFPPDMLCDVHITEGLVHTTEHQNFVTKNW